MGETSGYLTLLVFRYLGGLERLAEEQMGAAAAGDSLTECPECGTRLHQDAKFTTWCETCNWNVDPYPPNKEKLGRFELLEQRMARRYGERLFGEITKGIPLRPHLDATSVIAQGLALLVHASTVALVGVGLWFVFGGLGFVLVFVGLLMLAIAVVLRPRFGRLPRYDPLLDRSGAPELFALVDEVAAAAGTRSVERVAVDLDFNASVSAYGLRGRRLLTIGLPLWEILSPEERVALLGHELGHFSNGDQRYGGVLQSGLHSLSGWRYLLEPSEYEGSAVEVVVTIFTFLPYVTIVGIELLLLRLTVRSSQRGEYLADRLGARVGGTASAMGLLDRILLGPFVMRAIERVRTRLRSVARDGHSPAPKPEELWDGIAEEVAAVPEHELERLRRVGEREGHAVDATHPPTHLRRTVLALATPVPPEVVVDAARAARIETDLAASRHTLATLMQGAHELG